MSDETTQTAQTSGTSNVSPWAPQAGALNSIFNSAATAFNTASGAPKPNQFVNQFTPDQLSLFQSMVNAGTGGAGAVSPLLSSGTNATTGALSRLAEYSPTSFAGVLSDANAAANDPSVQGRIDAALRDARRSVYESGIPGIERNAALTGNTNSSRTGVREGILERGLADTTADTSADIRGQAYNAGLNAALARANAGDTSRLGALSTLLSGGNNAVGTGTDALSGLYALASGGVAGQQAGSQAAIDDALARYQFGVSSPFDALNNYFSIIGAKNWGGTTTEQGTSTKTTEASPFDTIGKLLGAGGAFLPGGKK